MRRRPTARTRLTILSAVALLCYQLLVPLPAIAAPAVPEPQATSAGQAPGISQLGYDPNWVTPAQPAPISPPDTSGSALPNDPSIGGPLSSGSARPPAVPTEVPGLRGEYSRTFANPNGSFSQEISQTRVNFRDKSGNWQPLDLRLVDDASGAYNLKVAASDRSVRFGTSDASTGLAQLSADGYAINLRAIGYGSGLSLQSTAVGFAGSGNKGALGIAPTDTGFEFNVTLNNAGQANVYQFGLDTGDLIPTLAADGQTILLRQPAKTGVLASLDSGSGNEVGRISAPGLLEADGAWVDHTPVKVQLNSAGANGYLITYTIDPTWLHDPGRQFPIILDPTTCIGAGQSGCSSGNDDEFIFSYHPDSHTVGWTVVRIGYDNNSGDAFPGNANYAITRGLFYFPDVALNSPTGDAVVTAADLAITINANQTDYGNTAVGKSYYAYPVNTPWGTNSVTWNNIVPNGFDTTPVSPAVVIPSSPNGKVLTFDIKDLARRWYTRRPTDWHTDEGVLIKSGLASHTEVLADGELYIYKYNSANTTQRPKLTITYDLPHVQIDFDPALGNTYAPSSMVAGQVTKLPIKVLNNNSGFDFDTTNWKVGWRWFDSKGTVVTCPGTCIASLPATISSGNWSSLFNISVTAPVAGLYTLRLDLVRVVSGTNLYSSDWALPSAYYSRNKKILTSDSTRWTGSSAIERDEFGISVTTGAGDTGISESVGDVSVNLASGNLHYGADTGLAFADLGTNLQLTYGYDNGNIADCGGILAACGWFTNWDERFSAGSNPGAYTYQAPSGNRYLANTDANGQLTSSAAGLMERPRITWLDEVNPNASGVTAVLAASEGFTAFHGSIVTKQASQTSLSYGSVHRVDLLHYRYVSFAARTTLATGVGIDFKIHNASNPVGFPDRWFVYTVGTDFTVSFDKIALGGSVVNAWASTNRRNLYSDLIGKGTFGVDGDQLEVFAFQTTTNGQTGSTYLDDVMFDGSWNGILNDNTPSWSLNPGNASVNTTDKAEGSQSIQVAPAAVSASPQCDMVCRTTVNHLNQWPYVRWAWKKVGGSTVAIEFRVKDLRTSTTGVITYYAGSTPPQAATNPIQVSPTVPTDWTYVERDLEDDARQVLNFYNDNPGGSLPSAPPSQGPTPDAVDFDAYRLIAYDGTFALFDDMDFFTVPNAGLDEMNHPTSGDTTFLYDFLVTDANQAKHYFNPDGLLIRVSDRDANQLNLDWSYTLAGTGQSAYTLNAIRAPADGMSLTSGTAQREVAVSRTTPSGFRQITFTEQLGSTSSYTGRRADFYVATSTGTTWGVGDLVKVSPARNNSATCGARPNGCVEVAYTSTASHFIDLLADPRWDGTTSGASDMRLDVNYDGTNRAYQIVDRSNSSVARLYVDSFDTGTGGSYRRVVYQDAAQRDPAATGSTTGFATYLDLNPDGQPLVTYIPKGCGASACSTSVFPPAPTSSDKLSESSFDGLAHISQTTSYRVGGQREVSRQATNAGAKVDNLSNPIAAAELAWTQSADQYFASLLDSGGGNPDMYRTEFAYNAVGQPIAITSPVANAHPDFAGTMTSTSGLSAYWRLGETSGSTAADSSGNGNTATISASGVTLNQPDALTNDANAAMLLNGSSGRLTSTVAMPQGAYTLEAWVNEQTDYSADPNGKGIVGRWASNSGALLYLAAGQLTLVHAGFYVHTPVTLATNRWYHVAATWDGAVARIFVDGKAVAVVLVNYAPGAGGSNFEIGSYANGTGTTFNNALIDEVALYNQALDGHRVLAHYLAGHSIAAPTQRTTYDSEGHPTETINHLLDNGGFESGLTDWESGNGATVSSTAAYASQLGLQIATTAYARQDIQLVPGQTARFQFYGKTDGGGSTQATYVAAYWQISSQSWVNLVSASLTTGSWTGKAFNLTVPFDGDGRVRVQFSNAAATGTAYFDKAVFVTGYLTATYSSLGLLTDTHTLQVGSGIGAIIRRHTAFSAAATSPAIFSTGTTANYIDGIYNSTYRDQDLTTTRSFDPWGRVLTSSDPDGATTTSTYAANMTDLASLADGLGNATTYTYDLVGNRLTTSSPAGLLTSSTYDFLDHTVTVTAPDGVVSQKTYDAYGQRTASYADYLNGTPSGASGLDDVKTAFTYDANGRQLTNVADTGYSGSPDATTTLTYDQVGNTLTSAESGTGVSSRTTTNYFQTVTPAIGPLAGITFSRSVTSGVRLPIAPSSGPAPVCPGPSGSNCNSVITLNLNGLAINTTDAYGKSTVVDYDLDGHAVRTIANYVDGVYSGSNPDTDIVSSAIYDIVGRLVSTTSCGITCSASDLRVAKTTYDDVDRPIQQTLQMPAGTDYSFTKTVYLPSGRVDRTSAPAATGTADSALTWTKTEYDAAGRAVRTLAHYDIAGNAHERLDAFEDGNLVGWTSADSGWFIHTGATIGLDGDHHLVAAKSGAGRLRMTTDSASVYCGTLWDLSGQTYQAGRTYHVHADLLAPSGISLDAFLGVDASGASYSGMTISTTGSWQSLDLDWVPSSSVSSNIHFALRKPTIGSIDAYLDNVQVWDTGQPDWNIPSETGYNTDSQPIASVLPPGHAGDAPLVTTTAYDPADRPTLVSVNARTFYSHQIMSDGQTNGMVGYWPLDERSGNTAADKKGTNSGTLTSTILKGTAGAVDESRTAYTFNGANDQVTIPDAASLDLSTAMTLEFWANSDLLLDSSKPANNWYGGVYKNLAYGLGWTTYVSGGGWRFQLISGGVAYVADLPGAVVEPHRWYHLMGTYDGTNMKLYVDGALVATSNIGTKTIDNSTGALWIGQMGAYWDGALDEVAVYNTALSSASAHYAAGRETTSDARLTTRTDYDALGRQIVETSPRGIRTASAYDRLGRTTSTTANYRDGAATGSATDDDLTATFAYDALGELLGSCSPRQVFATGCDPATPSNGQAWHFTYDAMGHQVSQTPPVNQTLTALSSTAWTYDAGGRLTSTCDFAAGGSCASATRHTDATYDGLGRQLTSIVYAGSGTGTPKLSWTTTFNPDGSQASLAFDGTASSEGTDTLTFTYDGLGRPDQVKRSSAVLTDNNWNASGTLATRIDGTLGSSVFGYDWANRLTSMISPAYSGTLTFAWRLDGLLDGRAWPVGSSGAATLTYDAAKRPTAFAKVGTAAASFSQSYDRDGNVTSEGRSLTGISGDAGSGTQSFTYDGANRVTAAAGLTASASYAYDRDANRTSATLGASTTTYAYDRTAELVSRTDSGVTTYLVCDAYGNQTSSAPAVNQNTAETYDLADRLTSITPPGQTASTFSLDALGRNLSRVTPGGTDAYEYVGTSESAWRITSGGVATSSALDPSGARIATAKSGTTGYLLPDLHANLAAVVNSGETALLAATRYDSFGQTAASYDSGASFPTPWRFQGRLDLSPDSHPLYDFGARTYDPGTGAFTQLDSSAGSPGDPLSLNRFAYAEANPWTLVDPDGHRPCADTGDSCQPDAASTQQWQQNVAKVAAQAAQVNSAGCRHAGDCIGRSSVQPQTGPPGYVWSESTIAGGQHILLPAQCAETADRYVGSACKRDAGSDLLLFATGVVVIATGGEVIGIAIGGGRVLMTSGLATACAAYCTRAQNFVASLIEGMGTAPGGSVSSVPVVAFSRSRAPGLASNFDEAVMGGAPTRLTRVTTELRDANRTAALRGHAPAPPGLSLDEYPFACSAQGGAGACVRAVPSGEQSYQGGVLSSFFQLFGIEEGDPFDVMFRP